MRFLTLSTLAAMVPSVFGSALLNVRPKEFGCGTRDPTAAEMSIAQHFAEVEAANNSTLEARQTVNVGVYFHVVASSTSLSGGYLTVGPLFIA
jgi:hypothetical protein